MEIVLVRHGQTEWNVQEIFRGHADIELNDTGRKQAGLLGEFLREPGIEAVYSSPLKRALDTARTIVRHHGIELQVTDGLNDMSFGDWQGVQVDVVKERYPELYEVWSDHPDQVRIPGGETLADVRERAMTVVDDAVARHKGRVVLVTHRVVIKLLTLALMGLDESSFWNIVVDTCGVTTFRFSRGRFVLIRHNDNSFLKTEAGNLADF